MSEQPGPYGNVPPVPPLVTRVDALERDLLRITDLQEKNATAIAALVNSVDDMRVNFDTRLVAIERQLSAIHQSNQLLIELISSRLPPPKSE